MVMGRALSDAIAEMELDNSNRLIVITRISQRLEHGEVSEDEKLALLETRADYAREIAINLRHIRALRVI